MSSVVLVATYLDTHLHCWDRRLFSYDWLEGTPFPERFTPADVADQSDSSLGAVFVEADRRPSQGPAEAAWAAQLHEGGPAIAAVVAFLPIERGDAVVADLDALSDNAKVTGVRRLLQDEPVELFDDPAVAAGLVAVGRAGLTFDACIRAHQLPALVRLRRRAPETTVVLDHLGKPDIDADWDSPATRQWLDDLATLADEPNTVVKLSGQASTAAPGSTFDRAHPFVSAALEMFGPSRCLVGSDWPVSRRTGEPYEAWFEHVAASFGLSDAEQELVLWRNAVKTYGIQPAG
jgi:L-fuconolactonase